MLLNLPCNEAWTRNYSNILTYEIEVHVSEDLRMTCPFIDNLIDHFKQLYKNKLSMNVLHFFFFFLDLYIGGSNDADYEPYY